MASSKETNTVTADSGAPVPLRPVQQFASAQATQAPTENFYEAVGGSETFRRLTEAFYEGVAQDPVIRPMYPEEDLGPAAERLQLFLEQYWGGPRTYSQERGHPRLRMRHAPYVIGAAERDAWLKHMRHAMDVVELSPEHDRIMWDYMVRAANFMVNSSELTMK
ncbi:globin [Natronoglycomyces albus]|uniref:Globin n=1 Tax=Natronoglycomyces albus TaxID=2811108 RepID=A0A895XSG6_9ACTN|nr:globin [Natronoglycomyces albus]QSB06269.1 globin [Natronoglycomyces albus]